MLTASSKPFVSSENPIADNTPVNMVFTLVATELKSLKAFCAVFKLLVKSFNAETVSFLAVLDVSSRPSFVPFIESLKSFRSSCKLLNTFANAVRFVCARLVTAVTFILIPEDIIYHLPIYMALFQAT